MNETHITEQDIESLAQKLAEFTESLSPGERTAFELVEQQLLTPATSQEAEVSGYQFGAYDLMADAHRMELLRLAKGRLTQQDHAGFWNTLLGALSGPPRGTRGR